jgi:CheY-like chemotaxis protein
MLSHYKSILLIEDDDDDQNFFIETVQFLDETIQVAVADSGPKALQILQRNPHFELIVLDLKLNGMSGMEFLRLIKNSSMYSAYRNIPVAVFTSSGTRSEACYQLGASVYIPKPFSIQLLRRMVATLLSLDITKDTRLARQLIAMN